jgi:hypothetical protein
MSVGSFDAVRLEKKTKHEKVLFWAGNSQKKHPPTSVGVFGFV